MSLIQGTWILSTPPATEPITVAEVAGGDVHMRLDVGAVTDETAYIEELIKTARQHAEEFTRRAFVTQSWTLNLDHWPDDDVILLPRPPTVSVTSVKYYDTDGTQQPLTSGTDYQKDVASEPARVTVEPGASWPSLESGRLSPIEVIYVAGYGAASAVPSAIKHAIKLLCAAWYDYREEITDFQKHELPLGARRLLWHYRMPAA